MISHLTNKGKPKIVDISSKKTTARKAIAEGIITFSKSTFNKIESLKSKKGEIINIAIIAGIMGAKKTSDLIPLCHNIKIEDIDISIKLLKNSNSLKITSYVQTHDKTGVEMEAITAVLISALTIYDMCKSIDKKIQIKKVKLVEKKGGKSDFKL